LRTSTQDAEEIKINRGVVLHELVEHDEEIEVPGVGDRPPMRTGRHTLVDIIRPRIEEIFEQVQKEIQASGYEGLLRAGVVLTGGTAQLPGLEAFAEEYFHERVKLGVPFYSGNLKDVVRNPRYSTAMGLVLTGMAQRKRGRKAQGPKSFKQILGRMRSWFERNF